MAANLHQRFPGWQRRLEPLPDYTVGSYDNSDEGSGVVCRELLDLFLLQLMSTSWQSAQVVPQSLAQ